MSYCPTRAITNLSRQEAPYGTWESPITADLLANRTITINAVRVNEKTQQLYYLQGDPDGRASIFEYVEGQSKCVLPHDYSVGSTVNGYGGGAVAINCHGDLVFVDAKSHDVCLLTPNSMKVERLLLGSGNSFADLDPHPQTTRYTLAIKESTDDEGEISTSLVVVDAELRIESTVRSGADFYTHPRFSPDGQQICWIQWNFPDMPWSGAVVYIADWHTNTAANVTAIAGHRGVCQPRWGLDGSLFFASDISGVMQLYRVAPGQKSAAWVHLQGLEQVEFAGAEFWLGSHTYVALTSNRMVVTYAHHATNTTILLDLNNYTYVDLQLPLIDISYDAMRRISDRSFAIIGSTTTHANALYLVLLSPNGRRISRCVSSFEMYQIPSDILSKPEPISFPRSYSKPNLDLSYGFFMAPTNPIFQASASTLPPCIIFAHGGPTKHARPSVNLELQLLTSRGYAVAILNYAGSTGYGREYRTRLDGQWGVEDVDDAASCVAYLVEKGKIDSHRVGIMGGSAGGYLTLQALCTYPELWASGISLCGISNMEKFAETTHKFERCYDELLVFGRTGGRRGQSLDARNGRGKEVADHEVMKQEVFLSRSPVHVAANLKAPVLLLQGADDKVVTAGQATEFYEAVPSEKRHLVKSVIFQGEGHGFHLAASIQKSLELQESWWRRTLVGETLWPAKL